MHQPIAIYVKEEDPEELEELEEGEIPSSPKPTRAHNSSPPSHSRETRSHPLRVSHKHRRIHINPRGRNNKRRPARQPRKARSEHKNEELGPRCAHCSRTEAGRLGRFRPCLHDLCQYCINDGLLRGRRCPLCHQYATAVTFPDVALVSLQEHLNYM